MNRYHLSSQDAHREVKTHPQLVGRFQYSVYGPGKHKMPWSLRTVDPAQVGVGICKGSGWASWRRQCFVWQILVMQLLLPLLVGGWLL